MFGHGQYIEKGIVVLYKIGSRAVFTTLFLVSSIFSDELSSSVNSLKERIDSNIKNETLLCKPSLNIEKPLLEQSINSSKPLIDTYKNNIYTKFYDYDNNLSLPIQKKPLQPSPINKQLQTPQNRLYIFMSSSVPSSVWKNYANYIDRYKIDNATMLLRGCIDGCVKIKPTLDFISDIVTDEGRNKDGLDVKIQIDPLLFRKYGVNEAPCFIYATDVKPNSIELSAGLEDNLKEPISYVSSCGDWSFLYHIETLLKKSQSKELSKLLSKIKTGR